MLSLLFAEERKIKMKKAYIIGVVSITVLLLNMLMVSSISAAWTSHSTGFHTFNNLRGDFEMAVHNYYQNNTSSSVELGWASLHIKYPSTCCIIHQEVVVWDGGDDYSDWGLYDSVQIDEDEYKVISLSLGYQTYTKSPDGAVTVDNRANFFGSCESCSTIYVIWDDIGSPWHSYEN
jgi:hypothetical protein